MTELIVVIVMPRLFHPLAGCPLLAQGLMTVLLLESAARPCFLASLSFALLSYLL